MGLTVIVAVAFRVGSATLVATIVALDALVTLGAVNSPALEIVPLVADHVTAVLLAPCTVAANC